jgi:predicted PurR-regulated permease PerM
VVVLLLAVVAALGWRLSRAVGNQLNELTDQIPQALDRVASHLSQYRWARKLVSEVNSAGQMIATGDVFARAENVLGWTGEALVQALLVLLVGLYGAISPELYVGGSLRLIPPAHRMRVRRALAASGVSLWWWTLCRLASVLWVTVATALALWLWGVPLPLALGVIAGVCRFAP